MNQRKTKKKLKRRINRHTKRGNCNQNCFIPATEDWCGKELFSIKEVRESFLSDILKIPRDSIKDTEIINSSLWKRRRKDKQGIAIGKAEAVLELLEVLGSVPADIRQLVMEQRDLETLTLWHKLAAKAKSIEEFVDLMQGMS